MPTDVRASLRDANSLRAEGRLAEAAEAYNGVLALDPDNVVALMALGYIAAQRRDFDAALKYLRTASAVDPKNDRVLRAIDNTLRRASRSEETRAPSGKPVRSAPTARSRRPQPPQTTAVPADISTRLKEANALRAKGRLVDAADAYNSVLALDPENVVALMALGYIATQRREFDTALKYLRAASAIEPKNDRVRRAIANTLRQSSQAKLPETTTAVSAADISTRLKVANSLRAKGRMAEAADGYKAVLALDPDHMVALMGLGYIATQRHEFDAALKYLQAASAVDPKNIKVQRAIDDVLRRASQQSQSLGATAESVDISARLKEANSLRAKGRMAEAADAYNGVLALDPENVVALTALGYIATQRREFDAALVYLQAASALDPKNIKVLLAIGDLLRKASRLEEARVTYEKVVTESPSNVRAIICLGLIARLSHDTASAISHFESALKIDPNAQIATDMLGQLRSENISRDNIRGQHLKILEGDSRNSEALVALARLARRDGDHEKERTYLEAASRSDPANLHLRCEYADAHRELDRLDDAEAIYKSVLALDGENARALTGLGFIARARGNSDEAAGYFKAAANVENLFAAFASRVEDGNLSLQRLFAGQIAETTLPTGSNYNDATLLFAPCRGATSLVITFGGNTAQLMLPSEITTLQTHLIAIRDRHRCFSMRGVPGLGRNYAGCLDNLRRLIAKFRITSVYCAGVSAGGYPALRYGLDLGANGVLAFSAPTTLDLADDGNAPLSRYPQLTALYRDLPDIPLDLAKLYANTLPRPRAILVYSPADKRDSWLANRMAGIEGVELDVAPEEAGHRVFPWLKSADRVSAYIEKLLLLRPMAEPDKATMSVRG